MPMHSLLITQCLQRDFIAPLRPHDPLPNALHVGPEESLRLMGEDPKAGPLAQLMGWARAQDPDALTILHIRDWHDPQDPAQQEHLRQFGLHCIQGTPGAELVLALDAGVERRHNETFVDATTLNDFEGTRLAGHLERLREEHGELRVGVVGVWTEAKITFLLYDLLTRGWSRELSTCSALTASASRAQHFNALEQLHKILGVRVHDSIGRFTQALLPHGDAFTPSAQAPSPQQAPPDGLDSLSEADRAVVSYLYRDAARLELDALSGGFSGASVFRVSSWDTLGHQQSGSVLKLGTPKLIGTERAAFERVESVLGNDAPSVKGFVDLGERAGLKYAYAAMGTDRVETFKSLFESGMSLARVEDVLSHVFLEILGRFFAAAQYERLGLFDYYTFAPRHADGVRERVAALLGDEHAPRPKLEVGGHEIWNPADFYRDLESLPRAPGEYHFVSYVHGDLNGANILLDARDNVWLIDFFHAHRGHILRDLAKLENDLLYLMTPIQGAEGLARAMHIPRALAEVGDLRAPLGDAPDQVAGDPALARTWEVLRIVRGLVGQVCRSERSTIPLHTAALRYAVHTLWFDEADTWQRRFALGAAGVHAQAITQDARRNARLRVDWLDALPGMPDAAALGLTICPGRSDRGREIASDLEDLTAASVGALFGFITDPEIRWAEVTTLGEDARAVGIPYHNTPVLDQSVPTLEVMDDVVGAILGHLRAGKRVTLHCMGGLGRSGTAAACTLVRLGLGAREAIAAVRRARSPRAVESHEQERFVHAFETKESA